MRVWITRYALTGKIQEIEAEKVGESYARQLLPSPGRWHGPGDWHTTREAAVKRAEQMRTKKIASLKKQIERLEGLKFEEGSE